MARFKKKEVPQPVTPVTPEAAPQAPVETAPAPIETATLGSDPSNEGGLPLPEGEQPIKVAPESALKATEKPSVPQVVGVSDSAPEEAALPPAPAPKGKVTSPTDLVRIRGMRDLDSSPTIGKFDFAQAVGKESRTGHIVRGKLKNGYIYVVPSYVADAMIERDWGMRI